MTQPASLETIRRAIRDANCFDEFAELVPFPEDLEDAWAISDRREQLLAATFVYSLIALRRLHEFLAGGHRSDDLSAEATGINIEYVLSGAVGLLSTDEKTFIDKQCAHLTSHGLADFVECESGWLEWPKSKSGFLKRLSVEVARLENGETN